MVEYFHVSMYHLPEEQQDGMQKTLDSLLAEHEIEIVNRAALIPVVSVMADSMEKADYIRGLEELGYKIEPYSNELHI